MAKPVALWSTPRSVSTAFDKMMRERGDHTVFTEPFSVPYYFGPERCSQRFAGAEEPNKRYDDVWGELDAAASEGPVFVKEMPHHLGPHLDAEHLERFTPSFLIRDPAYAVPSYLSIWPDATDEELGYEGQRRAFELLGETASGPPPPVIDARDLCQEPEAVVEAWCEAVDVPFDPDHLAWEPGMPDDWSLWSGWFTRAAASSEFAPLDGAPPPAVTEDVQARIDRCREHYEVLAEHCLL
jgi:hypothetical protein